MSSTNEDSFRKVRADFVQKYLLLGVSEEKANKHSSLTVENVKLFSDNDQKNRTIWNNLLKFYRSSISIKGSFNSAEEYLTVIENLKMLEEGGKITAVQLQKSLESLKEALFKKENTFQKNVPIKTSNNIQVDASDIPDLIALQKIIIQVESGHLANTLDNESLTIIDTFVSFFNDNQLPELYNYFALIFDKNPDNNTDFFATLIELYDLLSALKSGAILDISLPFEKLYPQLYLFFAKKELVKALAEFRDKATKDHKFINRKSSQQELSMFFTTLKSQTIIQISPSILLEFERTDTDDGKSVVSLLEKIIPLFGDNLIPSTTPITEHFVESVQNNEPDADLNQIHHSDISAYHPYYLVGDYKVVLKEAPDYDDDLTVELRQSYLDEANNEVFPIIDLSLQALTTPPYDSDTILNLRRGFHTLKGSGYMATFMYEGEIAWRVEEVLNGCRDGKFEFNDAIWHHANDGYQAIKKLLNNEFLPDNALERIAFQGNYLIKNLGIVDPKDVYQPTQVITNDRSHSLFEDEAFIASIKQELLDNNLDIPTEKVIPQTVQKKAITNKKTVSKTPDKNSDKPDNDATLHDVIAQLTRELDSYKQGNFGALKKLTRILNSDHQLTKLTDHDPKTRDLIQALFENILLYRAHGLSPQEQSINLWEAILIEVNNAFHEIPNYEKFDNYIRTLKKPIIQYSVANDKPETDQARIDNELFHLFSEEAQGILEVTDELLNDWKQNNYDPSSSYVAELRRQMHTLKGGSRMINKQDIGQLSHALESLLDPKYINQFSSDPKRFEILQRSLDHIPFMLEYRSPRMDLEGSNLLSALHLLLGNETPPELDSTGNVEGEDIITKVTEKTSSAAQAELGAIRVAPIQITEIYENLAENIILNNQQKRNIYQITNTLDELERTIARVNSQARRIEIETEAQMLSRRARVTHDSKDFDPLELDRFSELQQLSRFVMESVEDLSSLHKNFLEQIDKININLEKQSIIQHTTDLSINNIRTVNFLSIIPRLRRLIRQVSKAHSKKVELVTVGTDIQVERVLLEQMIAPFEHMIRNAIIHGIETPEERHNLGKNPIGKITIEVSKNGSDLVIRFSDDGQGIDVEAIRQKVLELGKIKPEEDVSDKELVHMLMLPGITTATEVSQDAGRGVGLDILAKAVVLLNASFTIENLPKEGLSFNMHLPFTLTTIKTLIVGAGSSKYAIPIEHIIAVDENRSIINDTQNEKNVIYQDENYKIHELSRIYGDISIHSNQNKKGFHLLFKQNQNRLAIEVNQVITQQEVIMKPLNPQISSIPGIVGSSILPNGDIVYIVDIPNLISSGLLANDGFTSHSYDEISSYLNKEIQRQTTPNILVVDDSITMRKVSTRMLERHGLLYSTAKDGLDAIEKLEESIPDLMMLDIEMPNMDGFEVLNYVQSHQRFKGIPVIMITSRTGEKHMERALSLGASRYCGKPYQEEEMIEHIAELLGDKWKRNH